MIRAILVAMILTGLAEAADMYCAEKSVEPTEGRLQLARRWERIFFADFEQGLKGWRTENYEGKLETGPADDGQGGKCLQVMNRKAKGDTAFEVASEPIPVRGGARFQFGFRWRSTLSMTALVGHKGRYMSQLQWLDAAGDSLEPTRFRFGPACKQWQEVRLRLAVPDKAVNVVIRIGFDEPNFAIGDLLAMDDIRLELLREPPVFERSGFMVSRPLRIENEGRRISWDADTPPGTVVRFQVASAPEENGGPGNWSEALGPDGTKAAYFTEPGVLPDAHKGHPWIRHVVTLETTDPSKTPSLKKVAIGDVTDGPWQGLDSEPPVVTERSTTRTADAKAPIWFRLADATGVDRRTVRVALGDIDITEKLVFGAGKWVYNPPEALRPAVAERDLSRWQVNNYNNVLSIERTARRTADGLRGFHITHEGERVDTAFTIKSPPIAVEPGAKYKLSFWSRHSMDLKGSMNNDKSFSGGVTWLGKGAVPVGERVKIDSGEANANWHQDSLEITAPDGALSAVISFGFDSPDIFNGAFVDIVEVDFDGPHPVREQQGLNLHRVTVKASDFAGNVLDREWYVLIRPPRTENLVALRDDGMTLIDGKPFFPIGLYSVWKKPFNDNSFDKAFADLKAAGFNTAHTYSSTRGADFAEFYAAAQRHGIKLYVASGAGANCRNVETVMWDVAQEEGQPALVAWYLADDTSSHIGPQELRNATEAIHDVDPAHITIQADGVGAPSSRYTNYVKSTDGFLPELYPIRDNGDKGVPQIIEDMKAIQGDLEEAGTRQKTIWGIVQYFQGWGWPRYPTRQELWAMSYLTIIHGAHGITWYTYGGHGNNHGVTDNPEVWRNICDLAGEISRLQDVLVERTGPQPPAPVILTGPAKDALGYASISILLKEHQGKKWLLAANSANAEVSAQVLVAGAKKVALPFEMREITPDENGFKDTFAPYGVHVYEIPK